MLTVYHKIFPPQCVFCRMRSGDNRQVCEGCEDDLPWIKQACKCCGRDTAAGDVVQALDQDVGHSGDSLMCGVCLKRRPPYYVALSCFRYSRPIDQSISAFKYFHRFVYRQVLVGYLIERIARHYEADTFPEVMLPVPLHRTRLRERGFNQALELARPIRKVFGIPIDIKSCQRVRPTKPQSHIPSNKRHPNVRGAFDVTLQQPYRHVAIVDDVVTTGATVSELSKALKKAGVKRVDVWSVAKV